MPTVTVRFHPRREPRTVHLAATATVADLLRELDEPLEGVLVFEGDAPLPTIETVSGAELLVVRAASGG